MLKATFPLMKLALGRGRRVPVSRFHYRRAIHRPSKVPYEIFPFSGKDAPADDPPEDPAFLRKKLKSLITIALYVIRALGTAHAKLRAQATLMKNSSHLFSFALFASYPALVAAQTFGVPVSANLVSAPALGFYAATLISLGLVREYSVTRPALTAEPLSSAVRQAAARTSPEPHRLAA